MTKEEIESLFKKYKVRIPKEKQGQSECYECKRHHKYSLTWTSFLYEYEEKYYCFEHIVIILLQQENQELKKQLEETNGMIEKCGFVNIEQVMLSYCGLITKQKGFINYLEDEKDRLARECSNIYEDGLGHTRLVNEDIFNEINDILQKYKEIIGEQI